MKIEILTHEGTKTIEAHVHGGWAAHPADTWPGDEPFWTVTHVPSGRSVTSATGRLTEDQAVGLAAHLEERAPGRAVPFARTIEPFQALRAADVIRIREAIESYLNGPKA